MLKPRYNFHKLSHFYNSTYFFQLRLHLWQIFWGSKPLRSSRPFTNITTSSTLLLLLLELYYHSSTTQLLLLVLRTNSCFYLNAHSSSQRVLELGFMVDFYDLRIEVRLHLWGAFSAR